MSTPTRDAIIARIRAEWPDYVATHDFPARRLGTRVPPVRDGGLTAALIEFAVDVTAEEIALLDG